MTTTLWIPEATQFSPDPDEAIRRADADRIEVPALADAEEEEIAALWAGDPGNQGA